MIQKADVVSAGVNSPMIHVENVSNKSAHQCIDDMTVLTLYDSGMIQDCSNAGVELLGCRLDQINLQPISKFVPELKNIELMQGARVNPHLRLLSRVGHLFEVVDMSGKHFKCKLFFNEVEDFGSASLRLIIRPINRDN